MGLLIKTQKMVTRGTEGPVDDPASQIVKLIPSEVVGIWVTYEGLSKTTSFAWQFNWLMVIICIFLTPIFRSAVIYLEVKEWKKVPIWQVAISTIAVPIWIGTLGGPFLDFKWYNTSYMLIIMIIYTPLAGLCYSVWGDKK